MRLQCFTTRCVKELKDTILNMDGEVYVASLDYICTKIAFIPIVKEVILQSDVLNACEYKAA